MASRTVPVFGQFHQKCGVLVVMSEGRRVASSFVGPLSIPGGSIFDPLPIAFSNDPIPNGVQFSVKVLQQGKGNVSPLIQTPCSLQCTPCLDGAHTTAVNSQLVSCRLV